MRRLIPLALCVALLGLAGCGDDGPSAFVTTAAPTTAAVTTTTTEPAATTTATTTTTISPTTTTAATTTTSATTTTLLTQDDYDLGILSVWEDSTRDGLIELLEGLPNVWYVDVDMNGGLGEPLVLYVEIEPEDATDEEVYDQAWELTQELAAFWERDGIWSVSGTANHLRWPGFWLKVEAPVWECDDSFMRLLAEGQVTRADWLATCLVPDE